MYLNIEQTRFGDRLQLEFDVEAQAESVWVPSLILQPLAENAIKHAIAQAENGGKISVSAKLENNFLIIQVVDTGSGLTTIPDAQVSGVGLRNTLDRLDEFYGDSYTFSLENAANGGLQVYMKLPLNKQSS